MSLRLVVLAALYLLVVALAAKHDGSHGLVSDSPALVRPELTSAV